MLNGLINLNKNKNITSFGIIQKLQKILNIKKIGHIGTLDPNATGILVCLLNDSCKFASNFDNLHKTYIVELILGFSTDSLDITGNIINKITFNKKNIKNLLINFDKVLSSFMGSIKQVPPMLSAKKVNGKKLYELARKNINVNRKACDINIYNINKKSDFKFRLINNIPVICIDIEVDASKGTYIRSLCDDIGRKLNIPSCMGDLKRVAIGDFSIKNSYTIDEIEKLYKLNNFKFIMPCYYQKENTAISIGKFEALHIGHIKILNELKNKSQKLKLSPLVFTFYNDNSISTNSEKYSRLSNMGFKNIISEKLDKNFKNMSADYFFNEIIVKQLRAKCIICGSDFCFGKDKKGNIDFLIKNCKLNGIELKIINKLSINSKTETIEELNENNKNDIVISSSNIKKYISDGNFKIVNKMLDRNYSINFEVNNITDNNEVFLSTNKLIPIDGIYDIYYYIDKICFEDKLEISKNIIMIKPKIENLSYIKNLNSFKLYFKY